MKALKITLGAMIISAVLYSCKKDKDDAAPSTNTSIVGIWAGAYGFDNATPSIFYSFNIKSNGVIEELNKSGNSKGPGTWTLVGNTFNATYTWLPPLVSTYTVSGTFDAVSGKLSGTWGYDDSKTNGGLWNMTKK